MQSVNNYRASKEPIQSLSLFQILREREREREGGRIWESVDSNDNGIQNETCEEQMTSE